MATISRAASKLARTSPRVSLLRRAAPRSRTDQIVVESRSVSTSWLRSTVRLVVGSRRMSSGPSPVTRAAMAGPGQSSTVPSPTSRPSPPIADMTVRSPGESTATLVLVIARASTATAHPATTATDPRPGESGSGSVSPAPRPRAGAVAAAANRWERWLLRVASPMAPAARNAAATDGIHAGSRPKTVKGVAPSTLAGKPPSGDEAGDRAEGGREPDELGRGRGQCGRSRPPAGTARRCRTWRGSSGLARSRPAQA